MHIRIPPSGSAGAGKKSPGDSVKVINEVTRTQGTPDLYHLTLPLSTHSVPHHTGLEGCGETIKMAASR